MNNVLITSAGRRAVLVQLFQQELKALVPGGRVLAVDLNPGLSSACQVADASFAVPSVRSDGYVDFLLDFCLTHKVGLVVPTIDTELQVLADSRERFAQRGVQLLTPDSGLVSDCRDKRRTAEMFTRLGIATPRLENDLSSAPLPLFAKPYDGSCSQGLCVIQDASDLTPSLRNDPKMLFFEYLPPHDHDEYTVDVYFNRHGELTCFVPRLRLETRGGEVSKGRTCRAPALQATRQSLSQLPGARGCLTAQFFVNKHNQRVFGIEINPRFGGGYPLSYESGANFPRWAIQEYLLNQQPETSDDWTDQLTMLRYDAHVLVPDAAA